MNPAVNLLQVACQAAPQGAISVLAKALAMREKYFAGLADKALRRLLGAMARPLRRAPTELHGDRGSCA